jgi:Uma2 family endonuclease
MTSKAITRTKEAGVVERFPDYPPRDDMQNWLHLYASAILTSLSIHFADRPGTIVGSEIPVGPDRSNRDDVRIPDMTVSFDSDLELIKRDRGYDLNRHGKPPDFVLEVASPSTATNDYTDKRQDYERYGIREYWRLDPSGGELYGAALAGDRLVDGEYRPVAIESPADGSWRGYSEVLGLYLCWEDGRLRFYDPGTESYLLSHQEEVARADEERARAEAEAEARRDAEAEVRRLREQLRELGEGQ